MKPTRFVEHGLRTSELDSEKVKMMPGVRLRTGVRVLARVQLGGHNEFRIGLGFMDEAGSGGDGITLIYFDGGVVGGIFADYAVPLPVLAVTPVDEVMDLFEAALADMATVDFDAEGGSPPWTGRLLGDYMEELRVNISLKSGVQVLSVGVTGEELVSLLNFFELYDLEQFRKYCRR